MDIIALNMNAMVHKHKYEAMNIDYPVSGDLYAVQFTPMPYTLQDSIEVNFDTIAEVI